MRLASSLRASAVVAFLAGSLAVMAPASADTSAAGSTSPDHAGFMVTDDSVRTVKATWMQPQANCQQTASFATFQFGFTTATQEVAVGTAADCHGGTVSQYAWVSFGQRRVKLQETVNVSDVMVAKVTERKGGVSVIVGDQTAGWGEGYSTGGGHAPKVTGAFIGAVARTGSSGVLALTDFGTLKLLSCTINHQPLKSLSPTLVTMKDDSGVVKAKPVVDKGRPAGVLWKHA